MLHIALGTTALERGLANNHLDGIGIYTQALLAHMKQHADLSITEAAFQRGKEPISSDFFPDSFKLNTLRSCLTGLPFKVRPSEKKMDLFHATDHYIPKLKNIPVIATLMDPVPLMRPDWVTSTGRGMKNWLFRRSTRWAQHYITISQAVVPDLVTYFDIPEEKIIPIHLGVNLEDFAPVTDAEKSATLTQLKLNPGFFLFIGTLQPRKNVARIIDAFSSLPLEIQREHPLVIVGNKGWSSEDLIEKLQKLVAAGTAHWLGYITATDKKILLQTAAALVFPSLYEGFGLPVLEAFASRLPVITSNTSSLPEIAGDAAVLIDPLDTEALADAMQRVITTPEVFESLIARGYDRATKMTWSACTEKTIAVYKNYLS